MQNNLMVSTTLGVVGVVSLFYQVFLKQQNIGNDVKFVIMNGFQRVNQVGISTKQKKRLKMTVYVDDMEAKYGRLIMCHMLADTDEELHAMADLIGVNRKWWQSPKGNSGSHYDIAKSKKVIALANGAIQITWRLGELMNRRRRETGNLGLPEEARAWYDAQQNKGAENESS